MFENGQQVVGFFKEQMGASDLGLNSSVQKCDVALLILDVNMPVLSGNEAMAQIKELFDQNSSFLRPVSCYLSATSEKVMGQFLTEHEQVDLYFQKPLLSQDLQNLIKLIDSRWIIIKPIN